MARDLPGDALAGLAGLDGEIRALGEKLGRALGQSLVAGIRHGMQSGLHGQRAQPSPPSPKRATTGAQCLVRGCVRSVAAKGLCATHYRKARLHGLPDPLDAQALEVLAGDGRKRRSAAR